MCGIAGYLGEPEEGNKFLTQSLECLKHRGPDGEGLIDFGWGGLSHVRLALISPGPNGAQPVESEQFTVSFNGEIYNWKEMATDLQRRGIRADLSSDSKVIIHSLETWGLDLTLNKLRGIFAFTILDKINKSIVLVRDTAGTKPLYYTQQRRSTFFASEVKAFRNFGLGIDGEQLHEYLTFQNSLGEKCLFKNVYLVPAGSYLKFHSPTAKPILTQWDKALFTSNQNLSNQDALIKLEELLEQAIERNLVADFPIGLFLSGGLDSSTIAMFTAANQRKTASYTIGFESDHNVDSLTFKDERAFARNLAAILDIENKTYEISASDMEREFDAICWAIEEPRVGQSYPNYFAAKLARQTNKAVLSGAGGDEIFGGYIWRYKDVLNTKHEGKSKQLESYLKVWHRLGQTSQISKLLMVSESAHILQAKEKMEKILEANSKNENFYDLEDLLYFEFKTFLQGLLLVDDKIAMSQELEVRVPLLDQDLVNFAIQLPNNLRLGNVDKSVDGIQGKVMLRQLALKMNNPVRNLPKQGFSGPDEFWFRKESRDFVSNRLLDPQSLIWKHLDFKIGSLMISDHLNQLANNKALIWSLLSLESVMRQFDLND